MSNATPPPPTLPPQPRDDSLSHLYKMSTTSVAGQEYVAINSTSITAFLLGVASVVALLADVLLIVPLAGMVCAIIAIVQIRRSNGTQSGVVFAMLGLVFALGMGGVKAGQQLLWSHQNSRDNQIISGLIEQFGKDVHNGRYDDAYEDLTSKAFREQVDRKTFAAILQQYQDSPLYGPLEWARWNGQRVDYQEVGTSGVHIATAMAMLKFQKMNNDFARPIFAFSDRDGTWKIDEISIYPSRKKQKSLE